MTRKSCHFLSFPTRRTSEDLPPPTPTELAKPLVFFRVWVVSELLQFFLSLHYTRGIVYSLHLFLCYAKKRLHSQGIKGLLPFPLTHNRGTFSPAKIIGRRAEEASSSPLLPRFFPPTKGTDFPFGNLFRPCDF